MYFDAKDAAALNAAMTQALKPTFEVIDAQGQPVAEGLIDGEAVRVASGKFSVRIKGAKAKPLPIVVKQKETTSVEL